MTWIAQLPALLAVLALLIVPGLPVAFCVRARGVIRLGVAIVVSLAVTAAASVIAPALGIGWSLLPVVLVALIVGTIAVALRLVDRTDDARILRASSRWVWGAVVLAAFGWMAVVAVGVGGPDHPNQLYDGLFHLNAVEFILQNADASPLHMTMTTPDSSATFYPTLWHAVVSLIVPVSGGVVTATNVVTLAVVGLIWPVALASLTSVVFPSRPTAAAWAALASFGFSVFPIGFLNWGVLYPNLLGTVLAPLFISVVVIAFAPALTWTTRVLWVLIVVAAGGATALAHPSALLGGVALVAPFLIVRVWSEARRAGHIRRAVLLASLLLGTAALAVIWLKANVSINVWLPSVTMAQAVGEVVLLSPVERTAGLLLGPLAALGIWQVIRMRLWWVLGAYAVSIGFYLASAWFPILPLRSLIVGVWYDDTTRVGALLAIWGLPLAGLGAASAMSWLRARWESGARRLVVTMTALVAVAAATHLVMFVSDVRYMRGVSFEFSKASQGLSSDEAVLFEKVDGLLDDDSVVIGDPLTGAGLFYAYTGHEVVFPHVSGRYGADADFLARNFADGDAAVCEAVTRLGITHAFDFGDRELFENHSSDYSGLHGLQRSPILTEIETVGDAALYAVSGCR